MAALAALVACAAAAWAAPVSLRGRAARQAPVRCLHDANVPVSAEPPVVLNYNGWAASRLNVEVARILLEEQLGMTVELDPSDEYSVWPLLADGTVHAVLEVWPSGHAEDFAQYIDGDGTVEAGGPLGVMGGIGWFTGTYSVTEFPEVGQWQGFTRPQAAAMYGGAVADDGETVLEKGVFTGPPADYVNWDAAIINGTGMLLRHNHTASDADLHRTIYDALDNRDHIVFYLWQPHPAFQKYSLARVTLPEWTPECDALPADDPGKTCDYPSDTLQKVFAAGFRDSHPRAHALLSSLVISNDDQIEMLHGQEFLFKDTFESACDWLRANEDVWAEWILDDSPSQPSSTSSGDDHSAPIIAASVVAVVVVIAVAAMIVKVSRARRYRKTKPTAFDDKVNHARLMIEPAELDLGPLLGGGAFGRVYRGTWRGTAVAVKELSPTDSAHAEERWLTEISLLSELRHPNIVQFLAVSRSHNGGLLLVTELLELGSVVDLLKRTSLRPEGVVAIAAGASRGLRYLHNLDPVVLHQDIKPANLLVDKSLSVKVCDFGLASIAEDGGSERQGGTLVYQAPERILEAQRATKACDVFSFGITMWELAASGARPYQEYYFLGETRLAVMICVDGMRPDESETDGELPSVYFETMRKCWSKEPGSRPTFDAVGEALIKIQSNYEPPASVAQSLSIMDSMNRFLSAPASEVSEADSIALAPTGEMAVVALRIEHIDALWLHAPADMPGTMEMVRNALPSGGYPIERDLSGVFVMAFGEAGDALQWVLQARVSVARLALPPSVQGAVHVGPDGLPVCAAIHFGGARRLVDMASGTVSYSGATLEQVRLLCEGAQQRALLLSSLAREETAAALRDAGMRTESATIPECSATIGAWHVVRSGQVAPEYASGRITLAPISQPVSFSIAWSEITDVGMVIGQGGTGRVHKATFRGKPVAVKKLLATALSDRQVLDLRQEVATIQSVDHERVVRLLAACFEAPDFALVMPLYAQSLRSLLLRKGALTDDKRRRQILGDVAAGMAFLHAKSIVHLNLKATNVLLDKQGRASVSDFGLARVRLATATMTTGGSGWHVAPEILAGQPSSGKSDVYSFGVMAHQMATGSEALFDGSVMEALGRLATGERPPPGDALAGLCWAPDPVDRPSFEDLVRELGAV